MFAKGNPPRGVEAGSPDKAESNEATVAFTREDVEAAQRLLSRIAESAERTRHQQVASSGFANGESGERIVLQAIARKIFLHRRERLKNFNPAMFGEPAWDMLLALYFTDGAGPRQSVGRLIKMSNAPATSALRWINYLEKEQLVVREAHPTDRRATFLELTTKGRGILENYLKSLPELGTE